MVELPIGTVTFLFTDIEGSTELLTDLGDRYPEALARHHRLMREALERHGGVEVMTEGDAFFVVFRNPMAALRATVDAQRALADEDWSPAAALLVRMGLHTGEAVLGGDNYVGLDVHRAARVSSAAHGGQVVLTDATRALVERTLADGLELRDLGRHRLKGLPAPERLFQLVVDGLPSDFAPLRSLEAAPNNLPVALTSFVGRERQVAEISQRLAGARLLTLTGPGGTGKTRLAVRVAEEVLGDHEDGCWFVALDALRDPELVAPTVAETLRVRVARDQPPAAALAAWLAERDVLLVLDNFEQVTGAAPDVARLLETAPRVRILATSRVPLGVYGEQEYPVPPLDGGDEVRAAGERGSEALSQYDSVRLFIERALAVKPDFRVTNQNAPAVAEICARLDGLPLAIELAAARVRLLTPEQMVGRLAQSMSLLASSAANLPPRQRTLRGAIDWSHDLLNEPERRLFARLAAFRGGFMLDAAEQVAGGDGLDLDVLEGVDSLVAKSLLRTDEEATETRFAMLQTIRDYARGKLDESPEARAVRRRHAAHFFALAAEAGSQLMGPAQVAWLERLGRDHDNLRAAFDRAVDLGMLDEALAAAGQLWRFWQLRGQFGEGRVIFDRLLAEPGASPAARAMALTGAGGICYWQGEFEAMGRHYREARSLYESLDDPQLLAEALYNESYVPVLLGEVADARPTLERARDLYRQLGNETGAYEAEWFIGFTYFLQGQPVAALELASRALEGYRAAGSHWHVADGLVGMASMRAAAGQWSEAAAAIREALPIFRSLGSAIGQAMIFEAVGLFAAWIGDNERSARLLGKADQMKEEHGGGPPTVLFQTHGFRQLAVRALGEDEFRRLALEGAALTIEEAATEAAGFEPPADAAPLERLAMP